MWLILFFFFFQAEDGIRDATVTGVQTCALPICLPPRHATIRGMDPAGLFLSISGRLAPKPFALGAILVYAASLASQALISPPIVARSGFWPFAAAQATLLWGWYALHVKRLRDAEEDAGTA